ncbi:uncharacterized protein LOC111624193 [Centruroides sculpturatus]|uniref:uncharacterized protein LOC111624193 n=1 Tax=Centruroides sculpturatus TaxID=218467 RepID=UPI000C6E55D5|nr:uncharacterized protein LOC111624193 [Centruroides sculpturatus]
MSSDATKSLIKMHINPTKLGIGVKNVRRIRKNGILVEVRNSQDVVKLQKELTEGPKELREAVNCRLPQKHRPRVILFDVDPDVKGNGLMEIIRVQNELGLQTGDLRPCFPLKGKGEFTNWVLEASPPVFHALLQKGRLHVGWTCNRLREYLSCTRCYKCYAFGHIARGCKAAAQKCSRCAHDHSYKECKAPEPRCVNCTEANRKFGLQLGTGHSAMSASCPCYARELERVRARTDYGL